MACSIEDKDNLGLSNCNEFPGLISGMIETNSDFAIAAADLADVSDVQDALEEGVLDAIASRIFNWPPFASMENISEEAVYQDTPLKYRIVRDGNYRFRFGISENLCLHKAMYTHRRRNGRVFLIDQNGYLIGTKLSNGDFAGFSIAMLNTEKLKFNDGSVASESPIVVALSNNIELDKNGYMFDASSFINELFRIVDVELTVVSASTTEIVVDVKTVCDQTPLSGLGSADFLVIDNDNGATHAQTAAESTSIPGRYTLTGTSFEASTVNLKAPADLSIKAYESTGSKAVTPV